MKLAWAAAATTLALAGCGRPSSGGADLVVLAGQSNALGYGLTAADLPADLVEATARSDVLIWQGDRLDRKSVV